MSGGVRGSRSVGTRKPLSQLDLLLREVVMLRRIVKKQGAILARISDALDAPYYTAWWQRLRKKKKKK